MEITNNVPTIGCMIWEGNYSVKNNTNIRYGKNLKYFEYNWEKPEEEQIVVFSDGNIKEALSPRFKNVKYKVAWLMESPALFKEWYSYNEMYNFLMNNLDLFSVVATCDEQLVTDNPNKFKFVPHGNCNVPVNDTHLYHKDKLCSLTSGVLRWKGHQKRIDVFNAYKDSGLIDFLGRGFNNPFSGWKTGFSRYMYHITIPNCIVNSFFGCHLLDPIACGTVPIYCGFEKINEFFDMDGIIKFNNIDELHKIMNTIGPEDYNNRLPAIKNNMKIMEEYRTIDNPLWTNVLSKLYKEI